MDGRNHVTSKRQLEKNYPNTQGPLLCPLFLPRPSCPHFLLLLLHLEVENTSSGDIYGFWNPGLFFECVRTRLQIAFIPTCTQVKRRYGKKKKNKRSISRLRLTPGAVYLIVTLSAPIITIPMLVFSISTWLGVFPTLHM